MSAEGMALNGPTQWMRSGWLYTIRQFEILDRGPLAKLIASEKRLPGRQSYAAVAYTIFEQIMPGARNRPIQGSAKQLALWEKRRQPGITLSQCFASARLAYANAWNNRGHGPLPGTVSKEGVELFNAEMQKSEQILLDAPPALKQTPLLGTARWLALTLDYGRSRNAARADIRKRREALGPGISKFLLR